MSRFWDLSRGLNIEAELRAQRPAPRRELVDSLVTRVGTERPASPWGRMGLAVAMSGLVLVAIASFGGVGYASSAAGQAVRKVERVVGIKTASHRTLASMSAAQSQYGPYHPPRHHHHQPPPPPPPHRTPPPKVEAGLPFTGLALWVPLALGLLLVASGGMLRLAGRRSRAK